ncbi:predicted protein [Sclerotinia sclerotiorum 1980 UF-70]|uniref:Uncharacterized protein n=1 Tax=Sclerotinia sclerotiorum (strain ATCC 18683 / 1980 / Ss-1) TaxID=665079 RepID=A7EHV9_SCLS1|nr:predicted protein [Sclerotinia sclerotiorum 1980 UF-70]EDO02425.1 predicted protein [Sclerotinia sclerotiorum 1980 UF-70]
MYLHLLGIVARPRKISTPLLRAKISGYFGSKKDIWLFKCFPKNIEPVTAKTDELRAESVTIMTICTKLLCAIETKLVAYHGAPTLPAGASIKHNSITQEGDENTSAETCDAPIHEAEPTENGKRSKENCAKGCCGCITDTTISPDHG